MGEEKVYPAMLWNRIEGGQVRCNLCPFRCVISEGKTGRCQVRKNINGELFSLNYHYVCAANVDAIEKKPLFHFQPGSKSFSIACIGCNFQCEFCQNWQISQMQRLYGRLIGNSISPEEILSEAQRTGCRSIAYTYTEPTVFFELAYETSRLAKAEGISNVFVSNGYISQEAREMIEPYLDGINVDLKSFRNEFYEQLCHAKLEPVLESLRWLAKSRIWLEVTTLVIPNRNDSDEELSDIAEFIAAELGVDVPWHVSRYHPDYRYESSPPTPMSTIERALEIGRRAGLRYCYGGNIPGHSSEQTYCPNCGMLLIKRWGFSVIENKIVGGRCPKCNTEIAGYEMSNISQ